MRAAGSTDSLRQSNESINIDKKGSSGPIRSFRQGKPKQARRSSDVKKNGRKTNTISFQTVR